MSTDAKGYLIPADAQPAEMGCLLVFYPQDTQNYYLRALIGSLSYLGTWTAWERDPAHRGQLAASAWKDANDCTFESMNCLTELVTVLQEIRDAITNQQAVCAPVVNVSVDDSDCCGSVPGMPATPPDETGIDPDPDPTVFDPNSGDPPPDGYDTWGEYLDAKCLAANYIADEIIRISNSIARLAGMLSSISVTHLLSQLVMIVPGGWLAALGGWVINSAIIQLMRVAEEGLPVFDQFVDELEANKNELVCTLYNWLSAETALTAVTALIDGAINSINATAATKTAMRAFFGLVLSSRFFNWYVQGLNSIVPEGYMGTVDCAACSNCGLFRNLEYGTGDIYGLGTRTLTAEPFGDNYRVEFTLDGNYCVEINWQPDPSWGTFAAYVCNDGVLESTGFPVTPGDRTCLGKFITVHSEPFTIDVNIIEKNDDCLCQSENITVLAGNYVSFSNGIYTFTSALNSGAFGNYQSLNLHWETPQAFEIVSLTGFTATSTSYVAAYWCAVAPANYSNRIGQYRYFADVPTARPFTPSPMTNTARSFSFAGGAQSQFTMQIRFITV